MEPFKQGYLKNDVYSCLITDHLNRFNEMFTRPVDVPLEINMGLSPIGGFLKCQP